MSLKEKNSVKKDIISLMSEGKFKGAGVRAKVAADQYPDDYEFRLLLAVALMNQEKYERAKTVLLKAVEEFPNEWDLWNVLGDAYGLQSNWQRAEASYRKALGIVGDAAPDEIADLHCSIADSLWEQQVRDEALLEWRKALEIDPECEDAKESLREHTNEYGEARSRHPLFDDIYHFQNIQLKRYYGLIGRDEFDTKKEADEVIAMIMKGWNERVSPSSRNWDKMTPKEKTKLFESIRLDFAPAVRRWKK